MRYTFLLLSLPLFAIAVIAQRGSKKALLWARQYLDVHARGNKILTINAWNEWTEGSYLEPDTKNKMKYLDALRDVFGRDRPGRSDKKK